MAPAPDIDVRTLLVQWWRDESEWMPVLGYPRECPSTAGYRASRQYDSDNGALDSSLHARQIARTAEIVHAMRDPYRAAIYAYARASATGTDPRWAGEPDSADDRRDLIGSALLIFAIEAGVA